MFLELYYESYDSNRGGYYSLPYAVKILDRERRAAFGAMLEKEGFRCIMHENGNPVMYVNFTLKRYGRNMKACGADSINEELLTEEQFMTEIFDRYKTDFEFRSKLENNYYESAKIKVEKNLLFLKKRGISNLAKLRKLNEAASCEVFALAEIEWWLQQMLDFTC